MTAEHPLWEPMCLPPCSCSMFVISVNVCLTEGWLISSEACYICYESSMIGIFYFHPHKRGKKWMDLKDMRMKAYIYAHLQSIHPLFLVVLLLVTAAYSYFPYFFLFLIYISTLVFEHTCISASLNCRTQDRSVSFLVLMSWGATEVIKMLCLWLESTVIMRKRD